MNDSTFSLLRSSLRGLKRLRLLRLGTRLYCFECRTLNRITDYFASGDCLLSCQHRRPAFLLDENVAQEFQAEVAARTVRREVLGHSKPTAGGFIRTFEELSEEA